MEAIEKKIEPYLSESLSKRVVKGGVWVFTLRIINRGLGFMRTIILARLLAPEAFGLLGIALVSIATLETFSQTGFRAALIQKKESVESYLDTAWTVSAVRGTILFLILFSAAPAVAKFFKSPEASLVIRVLSISLLLSGFSNVGIIFFQKELEFHKQFFYEITATLVDLSVTISLAFTWRNVWALVWGGLAASSVRLLMSYLIHPYRPRIKFGRAEYRDLFGFGKWIAGSTILVFLITQGDDILVGKMLGVTALGLYQMAYALSNLPATEISHVIAQVTFPTFSKLQENMQKLKEGYIKVLQITAIVALPLAGMILVLARDFTQIVIGDKWLPMVPAMQVLAFWGATRSIGSTAGPVFLSMGKPQILVQLQLLVLSTLAILIYPLSVTFNILGTSLAVCLASILPNILAILYVARLVNIDSSKLAAEIFIPLLNTIFMIILILCLKLLFLKAADIINFCLLILCGITSYIAIAYFFERRRNYPIITIVKDIIKTSQPLKTAE